MPDIYMKESLKAFKSLEVYQFLISGFIKPLWCQLESIFPYCFIKGKLFCPRELAISRMMHRFAFMKRMPVSMQHIAYVWRGNVVFWLFSLTPISRCYMPLADTSPKSWPRTWQAALGSRTTLIPTPFFHLNGVFPIVRNINEI